MRFSGATALFLGGGALASSLSDCAAQQAADLARISACGDQASLHDCLSRTSGGEQLDLGLCYLNAGCSVADSKRNLNAILERCGEAAPSGDVIKRTRAAAALPDKTPDVPSLRGAADLAAMSMPTPAAALHARDGMPQCFTTETVSTSTCSVSTSGVRLKTLSCWPTQVAKSKCAPGLMCSMDGSGSTVCMKMHNTLDVGGIIIAILFGVAIVLGISALTFMSCKESSEQKKLEARAEATALARAQTKKQRADQRAPLMRQGEGAGDPFSDRNGS